MALKENSACLRCHAMKTLGYLDSLTGRIVNLSVDSLKFAESNHKALKCIDCHTKDYQTYPHPAVTKSENLYCLNCHKDDARFAVFRFPDVEKEFHRSVHYKELGDKFSCFQCHDPHVFAIGDSTRPVLDIVRADNQLCLNCHNSSAMFANYTDKQIPSLEYIHSWLPNNELHWKYVRCVECHTPHTKYMSHDILAADQAERLCAECHTANSILMTKLYRYNVKEERQKNGFINASALNNAYVIGMTRNIVLDRLSLVLFGLMLLGVAGHAAGRAISSRRKNDE